MATSYGSGKRGLKSFRGASPVRKLSYRDQIVRCSISIPSNIAEGSSRDSKKDYKRFLQITLGSSFELETQLLLLEQNNVVKYDKFSLSLSLNEEVQKMLQTFMKRLN